MSAEGSSVTSNSQQSSSSFPKVKGGGPLFSGWGRLITGELVNNTSPGPINDVTSKISNMGIDMLVAHVHYQQFEII